MSFMVNSTGDASDSSATCSASASSIISAGLLSSGKPGGTCARLPGLYRELSDSEYIAVKEFVSRVSEAHMRFKEVYSG
jgi:hypothetical protein